MCALAFALDGRADDLDLLAREQGVKGGRELCVAIVDQEPDLTTTVVEFHQQVARLLQHPGRVRVGCMNPFRPSTGATRLMPR
jgi:hypothetical protein